VNNEPIPKIILLTNSLLHAYVDQDDYEKISQFSWFIWTNGSVNYAFTGHDSIKMHHMILGKPAPGYEIHHKNGNGLDNTKANLELLTRGQHLLTRDKQSNNISGYKGVAYKGSKKGFGRKWVAQVTIHGKRTHLGYFDTAEQAALAYNKKAKEIYGEKALLNIVKDPLNEY
jgi:hypothetical protein